MHKFLHSRASRVVCDFLCLSKHCVCTILIKMSPLLLLHACRQAGCLSFLHLQAPLVTLINSSLFAFASLTQYPRITHNIFLFIRVFQHFKLCHLSFTLSEVLSVHLLLAFTGWHLENVLKTGYNLKVHVEKRRRRRWRKKPSKFET